MDFYNKGQLVKTRMIRLSRLMEMRDRKNIYLNVKVPEQLFDTVKAFVRNPGSGQVLVMDDFQVWSFR